MPTTQTSYTMSGLQPGLNTFTVADMSSQGTMLGSASDSFTFENVGTVTTLTSSATGNSAVYGSQVTLTATVTQDQPIGIAPTGEIDFYDGTTKIGSGMLTDGQDTVSISVTLPAGSHEYRGDLCRRQQRYGDDVDPVRPDGDARAR